MARIVPEKAQDLIRTFERLGFKQIRQTGSHVMLIKGGCKRPLVIPRHGCDIRVPIILGLLRTAGIDREKYLKARADC